MISRNEIRYRVYYTERENNINFFTEPKNYEEAKIIMGSKLKDANITSVGIVKETILSEVIEVFNKNAKNIIEEKKTLEAAWLIWAGWKGNHDQRIEGAKCSHCDFTHPTVYRNTDKLSKTCPGCQREMSIIEQG